MAFKPTQDQQKAIEARGNVLVSAAAGSGKTAVLVERVIRLLSDEDNPIDANRLLIVTFTNAAASEMRTRIEKRLFDEIKKTGNRRLAKQRLLIYSAKICTIDAFCIDFVKNHFALLGIAPDFRVADVAQERKAKETAFRQTFAELSAKLSVDFTGMMACLSSTFGVEELKAHLFKIWEHSRSMPFPERWLISVKDMYENTANEQWLRTIFNYASETISAQQALLTQCLATLHLYPDTEKYVPVLENIRTQLMVLEDAVFDGEWDKVRSALNKCAFPVLPKTKADISVREKIKTCKAELSQSIKTLQKLFYCPFSEICKFTQQSGAAVCGAIDFILQMSLYFEEYMRRISAYPFDMIERMALRLLCHPKEDGTILLNPDAAALCDSFDEILVDEYQDTNDLQDTLFKMLASQSGNLFTVGDVKQSIYKFRHANPNNFLLRKSELPQYTEGERDGSITLSNNFRSRSDICDFVNFTFSALMHKETANISYDLAESLVYSADFSPDEDGGVEYHIIEKNDDLRSRKEMEADYIARYIRNIVEGEKTLCLNGQTRKARYGDFAVLMQSPSGRAPVYAQALQKLGIPVVVESKAFYETAEISLALSMLKIINNPTNDVALLAVLMSGLFGFSAEQIAEIKMHYTGESLIGKITAAAESGQQLCAEFISKLSKLRLAASTVPLGNLVGQVYEETGLLILMSSKENGEKRRENLLKLLNMADGFVSQTHTATLSSFLRSIENSQGMSVKSTAGAEGNAVRIMSIHAAKGLQFPYCILADNATKFNITDQIGRMLVDEELGIGLKYVDAKTRFVYDTLARKALSIKLRTDMIAEKIRLLYVAMTRAEYKLDILICENNLPGMLNALCAEISQEGKIRNSAISSAPGYSSWLLSCALIHPSGYNAFEKFGIRGIAMAETTDAPLKITFVAPSDSCEINLFSAAEASVSDDLLAQMKENFSYVYPYKALQTIPSKLSVSELTKQQDAQEFAFTARPVFAQESGLTSAEKGTATHKFMQHCDFASARNALLEEIERLYEYEFLSAPERKALNVEGLRAFFASDICARILKAEKVYKEFPFMLPVQLSEELPETSVVQGVVDCVAVTADGVRIIDYKTDNVTELQTLITRYAGQVSFYADAISRIFHLPVLEKGIYSFTLNEYIPIE
ncbi:MAG: helicase-exonuclease AddAB subunit AddA [Clostridia bacterium]|nr:helicase-exonuclease AddAB subunit AddA [Clostridia bacterium]